VRAEFPKLPAAEVVHRLTATARDKGPSGRDAQYGFGVLDLVAALTATVPPLPTTPTTAAPSSPGGAPPGGAIDTPSRHEGLPVGVMLVGLGCLLLVTGAAAAIVWHLARRRRAGFGVNT
jgi:hypothetical protein